MCLDCYNEEFPNGYSLEERFAYIAKLKSFVYGVQEERRFNETLDPNVYMKFFTLMEKFEKEPTRKIFSQVRETFENRTELLVGLREFLIEAYPEQYRVVLEQETEHSRVHQVACLTQSASRLMNLPRELRDKIWAYAIVDNVVHISKVKGGNTIPTFRFHACYASDGLNSSACPPGKADHKNCSMAGPGNFTIPQLVCKQLQIELPKDDITFFSQNALHFSDLVSAEEFLFAITESQRGSIAHLKFNLPSELAHNPEDVDTGSYVRAWTALTNYFSVPWTRSCLGMVPEPEDPVDYLKMHIDFYYSSCYYEHNKYRLHKRYQVQRGNTSWDISIAGLKLKSALRLDLAMRSPAPITKDEGYRGGSTYWDSEEDGWQMWDTNLENAKQWVSLLLNFKQFRGLDFKLYDERGLVKKDDFEEWLLVVKEEMKGEIGPRMCVNFRDW